MNNFTGATKYAEKAEEIEMAINSVLWDDSVGVWLDYGLQEQIRRNQCYPSNIFPLRAGIDSND